MELLRFSLDEQKVSPEIKKINNLQVLLINEWAVWFRLHHSDGFYRGDKLINLKALADDALLKCRDK